MRQTESLDWTQLERPVYVPLIGRETELETKQDLDVFARVLQGVFVDFAFGEIAPPPSGTIWATDGVFVQAFPLETALPEGCRVPAPHETILQVTLDDGSDHRARRVAAEDAAWERR